MKLLEALSELSHREERKILEVTSLHNAALWDKCSGKTVKAMELFAVTNTEK